MALELISTDQTQIDLFTPSPLTDQKKIDLTKIMDGLNHRFDRGTIFLAAFGKRLTWKDQKLKVSPAYTTNWLQLPIAYA